MAWFEVTFTARVLVDDASADEARDWVDSYLARKFDGVRDFEAREIKTIDNAETWE